MKNTAQNTDVLLWSAGACSRFRRASLLAQERPRQAASVQSGSKRPHSQAGFSLLEILVATSILAIGFIALVRIFPFALLQTQIVAERTEVSSLARSRAGMLRSSGVGDAFDKWAKDNMMKALTDSERAYALYTGWTSSVQRMGGLTPLYRVTFTVQMLDGGEESFVTYVTEL